jgi:N,N'-diacetyllegionaminate synthase
MDKVIIIAEAGVNHNGNLSIAKELIEVAAKAGADYVKFQSFKSAMNISPEAKKASYQIETTDDSESQLDMIKKLEMTDSEHFELVDHCKLFDIKFLSTAFDVESVNLLEKIDIDFFKIPSGEIVNSPLLSRIAQTKKKIVLSTGMSSIEDIDNALNVLYKNGVTSGDITILHCNTEYPTPFEDVNLLAMNHIKNTFLTRVGYSDHTLGIEVPIAAVALGATVIEKHFTLDRSMDGPDHKSSLEPNELENMISSIRRIEMALGDGIKQPTDSERKNLVVARKSVHTNKPLKEGTQIAFDDLVMLRPGDGISPMEYEKIIGKHIKHDLDIFHKISLRDVE